MRRALDLLPFVAGFCAVVFGVLLWRNGIPGGGIPFVATGIVFMLAFARRA